MSHPFSAHGGRPEYIIHGMQSPRSSASSFRASATRRCWDALASARDHLRARDAAIVKAQIAISTIPAPTGDEGERGAWVAERFHRLALSRVGTDAAGNVCAWRPGRTTRNAIVVCAHLDTVFPAGTDLAVTQEGTRLVGPGIGDNARGVAAMLAVAEALHATKIVTEAPIVFVATTGEEGAGDLRGARHLFSTMAETPGAAIILDGPGDDRVVHQAVGSRRFRIRFRGPGGHSWADFGAVNAVHAAAHCASLLTKIPLSSSPRTTLTVGRIGGGTSINTIAADASLDVDVRSTETAPLDRIERELRRLVADVAADLSGARRSGTAPLAYKIEMIGARPGGAIPDTAPLVRSAFAATELIGRTPISALASTDANIPLSLGIPAVALGGGGSGGGAHTAREWYENTNGAQGIARALVVIAEAAGATA
jgi:acetylornithine deacetylase/succinyl-diaminopimelate desuccinylase-like protein